MLQFQSSLPGPASRSLGYQMECLYPLEGRCWPESVVCSPSYVRLIVHPELLVRAISRSCALWGQLNLSDTYHLPKSCLLDLHFTELFLVMISNVNLVSRTMIPSKPTRLTHRLRTTVTSAPCMSAVASSCPLEFGVTRTLRAVSLRPSTSLM